jgi:hypothetical protein
LLVEEVCIPVMVDLIHGPALSDEVYYVGVDGKDPSDQYLAHIADLARRAGRTRMIKKRSDLTGDQAAQPRLTAVLVSCGGATWESAERVQVYGSGGIPRGPWRPMPRGGMGGPFILERRDGVWTIIQRGPFWVM